MNRDIDDFSKMTKSTQSRHLKQREMQSRALSTLPVRGRLLVALGSKPFPQSRGFDKF
jgi:hypothetical protein